MSNVVTRLLDATTSCFDHRPNNRKRSSRNRNKAQERVRGTCVCSSHYTVISTRRHSTTTVRADSSTLEKIQALWSQNYDKEILQQCIRMQ